MASIAKHSKPKQASHENEHVVPLLPAERPRRLSEAAFARHDSSLRHYGLFGRLPMEVRQKILTEALGGRRLHVKLSFDHPLERVPHEVQPSRWKAFGLATRRKFMAMKGKQPQPQPQPRREQREPKPEGPPTHCDLRTKFVNNKGRPKCWQWFGCVCHRREEHINARGNLTGWNKIEPIFDYCCSGDQGVCSSWPPERRAAECFVGAMGWLLTCRQAYADAIDILYSTNEFHLSDAKLIRNLPRLILPQRLASIRALELLWLPHTELLTHAPGPPGPYDTEEARRWLCNTIPIMFPRLEKLHLSLSYYIKEPGCLGLDPLDDSILQAERIILGPVEAMLLKLPHASRTGGLSVAIDATLWKVLLRKHDHMRTPGLRADVDCFAYHGRFWKRFPGQEDEDGDAGYWVCSGYEAPLLMGCFGTGAGRSSFDDWGFPVDEYSPYGPLSCPHTLEDLPTRVMH